MIDVVCVCCVQAINTKYDADVEQLSKKQKRDMEKLAQSQDQQYKVRIKELKAEQVREQKLQKEQLKEAEKSALKEVRGGWERGGEVGEGEVR